MMFISTRTGSFVCFFELVQGRTSSTRIEFIRVNKGINNVVVKCVSLVPCCVYCSSKAFQIFTVFMYPMFFFLLALFAS